MSTLKCRCEKTPALSSVSTFSPKLNMNNYVYCIVKCSWCVAVGVWDNWQAWSWYRSLNPWSVKLTVPLYLSPYSVNLTVPLKLTPEWLPSLRHSNCSWPNNKIIKQYTLKLPLFLYMCIIYFIYTLNVYVLNCVVCTYKFIEMCTKIFFSVIGL